MNAPDQDLKAVFDAINAARLAEKNGEQARALHFRACAAALLRELPDADHDTENLVRRLRATYSRSPEDRR